MIWWASRWHHLVQITTSFRFPRPTVLRRIIWTLQPLISWFVVCRPYFFVVIIIIILTFIFFKDLSRVWISSSEQHKVENQPLSFSFKAVVYPCTGNIETRFWRLEMFFWHSWEIEYRTRNDDLRWWLWWSSKNDDDQGMIVYSETFLESREHVWRLCLAVDGVIGFSRKIVHRLCVIYFLSFLIFTEILITNSFGITTFLLQSPTGPLIGGPAMNSVSSMVNNQSNGLANRLKKVNQANISWIKYGWNAPKQRSSTFFLDRCCEVCCCTIDCLLEGKIFSRQWLCFSTLFNTLCQSFKINLNVCKALCPVPYTTQRSNDSANIQFKKSFVHLCVLRINWQCILNEQENHSPEDSIKAPMLTTCVQFRFWT